jgi:hypothetical protein
MIASVNITKLKEKTQKKNKKEKEKTCTPFIFPWQA